MIFVSGANGRFARAVTQGVLAAGRGTSLAVGTRDTQSAFAQELAAQGVRVREADLRHPELSELHTGRIFARGAQWSRALSDRAGPSRFRSCLHSIAPRPV